MENMVCLCAPLVGEAGEVISTVMQSIICNFSSYWMYAWDLRRRPSSVAGVSMPTTLAKSLWGSSPYSSKYFFISLVVET